MPVSRQAPWPTEWLSVTELLQLYLKVFKATGEVQNVPKVSLGISAGACGFSLLQLLGDCIELQGPDGEDFTSPQELFSCNSHALRNEYPALTLAPSICPSGQQLSSMCKQLLCAPTVLGLSTQERLPSCAHMAHRATWTCEQGRQEPRGQCNWGVTLKSEVKSRSKEASQNKADKR